jgi:putative ABC transport system permease protein
MKDFNFSSLHEKVRPLVIFPYKQDEHGDYLSVRIKPGNYLSTLSFIKNTWAKYSNNETPDYTFLDQDIQKMYLADQRTGKIAAVFSILAIVIACLGLFGLATFISEQRTKEIGIRKVLGASVHEIIGMLSKEFVKWIIIANVIAWPLAYYFMHKWLQNFAYRTEMSIWIFISSGAIALLIALLTISTNAIKASTANPIKSLKYE